MADETLLVITNVSQPDLPPYAVRGIEQTLEAIGGATNIRRTVFGNAVNLALPSQRKYQTTITCRDQQSPRSDFVWEGDQITVDCVAELWYLTSGGSPARTVVPGSSRVEGSRTFYRPRLTMLVVRFSFATSEYGADVGWNLDAVEV